MLGDYRYYKENRTDAHVINLFALSGQAPSSHFTTLRIISFLLRELERPTEYGRGFIEIQELLGHFELVFANPFDARFHLERLLRFALVEADTGILTDLNLCHAVRLTAGGEYYLHYLSRAFAYLDLAWMDTSFADAAVVARMRALVEARDKDERFERVDLFLRYLTKEEERDITEFPSLGSGGPLAGVFMKDIVGQIEKEKRVIARNFARYATPRPG